MHKNLSGPKNRKAKNYFYCGSLCQRLVLSFRKRNFLIRQLFLVKTDRQRLKTSRPKKTVFPSLPTISHEIPNKYGWKSSIFSKNLCTVFWFRGDIWFWQFFDHHTSLFVIDLWIHAYSELKTKKKTFLNLYQTCYGINKLCKFSL